MAFIVKWIAQAMPPNQNTSMPPTSNLHVQVDALFQALKNAPLEDHWNVLKSASTDIPTMMMPSDGVVKAEDLIKHPNYTMLCAAIRTSPSRCLTFSCISKAFEQLDAMHGDLLSRKTGKERTYCA